MIDPAMDREGLKDSKNASTHFSENQQDRIWTIKYWYEFVDIWFRGLKM